MNLNVYLINDYIDLPVEKAVLHSSTLKRELSGISFYRTKDQKSPERENIIITSDILLKPLLEKDSQLCILCRGVPVDTAVPETADVIFVSEEYEEMEIYEKLQQLFKRFYQWEMQMGKMVMNGASMQAMGNIAMEFLYNPIALYTVNHQLIFYSERKKEGRFQMFHEEYLNTYLPDSEIDNLKLNEEFRETMEKEDPDIFSDRTWGYRILYYNVRISGLYVARVMALEIDRPLKDSDACLLVFLAEHLKQLMQKQNIVVNRHPEQFDTCINMLLARQKVDAEQLASVMSKLKWKIEDEYFCSVIKISSYDRAICSVPNLCIRLEENIKGGCAVLLADEILLLVNLRVGNATREESLMALAYILREGLLKAGVSNCFRSMAVLSDYYEQAKNALRIGEVQNETLWCYRYESYSLQHKLERLAGEYSIRSLCPQGLLKLMEYDLKNNRNYSYALKIYLEQNMSIAKTIRILYLQRATFLYQLRRIGEISGLKLEDYRVRLELLIVFELMEERGLDLKEKNKL
ncbi:MAG: helix-turn-helix domain-containing protein [Lachnospiraceae bacterium]|nr:helix-turn-helix domain-containing protein [Lachnospiraceae bacterium]